MDAAVIDRNADLFALSLRLGDNALILGQRLGEWVRRSPTIELDIALANFALDYVGQARMWLSYAGELEGRGRGEDELAYHRDSREFTNLLLLELPNGDFGRTMLRLFFHAAYAHPLYEALSRSAEAQVAAIAAKAEKETAYHLRHSAEWVVRLGDGSEESHRRMAAALDYLWPYTAEPFAADEAERRLADAGIGADLSVVRGAWEETVNHVLKRAMLQLPNDDWRPGGGREGRHSEHLGPLLAEMQSVQRAYPGCDW